MLNDRPSIAVATGTILVGLNARAIQTADSKRDVQFVPAVYILEAFEAWLSKGNDYNSFSVSEA